ncbi:hypothetical protein [Alkalicoccus luteus]|nr:hypothetical protein [Alkalicoccus luteus]
MTIQHPPAVFGGFLIAIPIAASDDLGMEHGHVNRKLNSTKVERFP